jgi:menaquinone-dependent protoporphyrinogen IX oxidase
MMGKTLIVFSTISGLNDEVAHIIANTLETFNMDATMVDLRNGSPDITPFQNVVVGGGGGGKNVYNEAIDFMANDFTGKNVALFFLCEGGENPNEENTKVSQRKLLSKNMSVKPIDVAAFGGCMISQNRTVMDDLNMAKVKDWAMELGKKFNTISQRLTLLNAVPFENRFQFYTELGENTGITADGVMDFAEKLQTVPIQSVTFHFKRQDFQKWLQTSVCDDELARRIDQISLLQNGEDLKKELSKMVDERITELTKS